MGASIQGVWGGLGDGSVSERGPLTLYLPLAPEEVVQGALSGDCCQGGGQGQGYKQDTHGGRRRQKEVGVAGGRGAD